MFTIRRLWVPLVITLVAPVVSMLLAGWIADANGCWLASRRRPTA